MRMNAETINVLDISGRDETQVAPITCTGITASSDTDGYTYWNGHSDSSAKWSEPWGRHELPSDAVLIRCMHFDMLYGRSYAR
jgi:hypothetical protein